jgi:hypothetical protein
MPRGCPKWRNSTKINQGSSKDWKMLGKSVKAKDLVTGLWNDRTANIYR